MNEKEKELCRDLQEKLFELEAMASEIPFGFADRLELKARIEAVREWYEDILYEEE
jgi:hypothetical protein